MQVYLAQIERKNLKIILALLFFSGCGGTSQLSFLATLQGIQAAQAMPQPVAVSRVQ